MGCVHNLWKELDPFRVVLLTSGGSALGFRSQRVFFFTRINDIVNR